MPPLTLKRLRAIQEALVNRLAGEIDIEQGEGTPTHDDYKFALYWTNAQIEKRENKRNEKA